jgi:hypothetical protein
MISRHEVGAANGSDPKYRWRKALDVGFSLETEMEPQMNTDEDRSSMSYYSMAYQLQGETVFHDK